MSYVVELDQFDTGCFRARLGDAVRGVVIGGFSSVVAPVRGDFSGRGGDAAYSRSLESYYRCVAALGFPRIACDVGYAVVGSGGGNGSGGSVSGCGADGVSDGSVGGAGSVVGGERGGGDAGGQRGVPFSVVPCGCADGGIRGGSVGDVFGSSCTGVEESSGFESVAGSGGKVGIPGAPGGSSGGSDATESVRGKHYLSNKRKRLARKKRMSVVGAGGASVVGFETRVPLLEGASDEQRKEFIASRLQMMTAKNKLMAAEAVDKKKNVDDRTFTRVAERKLELERMKVDAELRKLEDANGSDFGFFGSTVASEPSLSTGTVSPDSSISVAEEMRLRRAVVQLQTQLKDAQLTLELERTVGKKDRDELRERYALVVNADLEKVAGGMVIKKSASGKEFLGLANELDDDGESYPDVAFSHSSYNGEEVW